MYNVFSKSITGKASGCTSIVKQVTLHSPRFVYKPTGSLQVQPYTQPVTLSHHFHFIRHAKNVFNDGNSEIGAYTMVHLQYPKSN